MSDKFSVGMTVFYLQNGFLVSGIITKETKKFVYIKDSQYRISKTGLYLSEEDYIVFCINYIQWLFDRKILRGFEHLRQVVDGEITNVRFESWLLSNGWLFGSRDCIRKILNELENYPEELI